MLQHEYSKIKGMLSAKPVKEMARCSAVAVASKVSRAKVNSNKAKGSKQRKNGINNKINSRAEKAKKDKKLANPLVDNLKAKNKILSRKKVKQTRASQRIVHILRVPGIRMADLNGRKPLSLSLNTNHMKINSDQDPPAIPPLDKKRIKVRIRKISPGKLELPMNKKVKAKGIKAAKAPRALKVVKVLAANRVPKAVKAIPGSALVARLGPPAPVRTPEVSLAEAMASSPANLKAITKAVKSGNPVILLDNGGSMNLRRTIITDTDPTHQ